MANRHLDRVLAPTFLQGLDGWPVEEIRERRAEGQTLEDAASYLRRLVQARLDIIGTELRARAQGQEADLVTLIEQLPSILSENTDRRSMAGGRYMQSFFPAEDQQGWAQSRCDTACSHLDIARAPELSDEELITMADGLTALESQVSGERRRLHEILDALQVELVRRYKSGEAKVEGLLR
jgi:hypothetical protein